MWSHSTRGDIARDHRLQNWRHTVEIFKARALRRWGRTLLIITMDLMVREVATVRVTVGVGREYQELLRVLRKSFAWKSHDYLSWTSSGGAVVFSWWLLTLVAQRVIFNSSHNANISVKMSDYWPICCAGLKKCQRSAFPRALVLSTQMVMHQFSELVCHGRKLEVGANREGTRWLRDRQGRSWGWGNHHQLVRHRITWRPSSLLKYTIFQLYSWFCICRNRLWQTWKELIK